MENLSRTRVKPVFFRPRNGRFDFAGFLGERLRVNEEEWLLKARTANPAMIEAFALRDRQPRLHLLPFYGEYPGKFLTGSVLCWRISRSARLKSMIEGLVADLASVQDADGYLGPHPKSERLTGATWDGKCKLWDVWGHYHVMLGLLLWFKEMGDKLAWDICLEAADLICRTFLDSGQHIHDAGSHEMNMAISHIFCLLYEETGENRYLRLVREIEQDWQTPPAGDYLRTALEGKEFYETPKPRWESLHDIQAMAELYFISGEEPYRQAFEHIWQSIARYDRHNTGGFSSGERATGNPYDRGAIETCCAIAWIALSIDMLRMTGQSRIADEIELSTLNGLLGAQSPSGRWWTYDTPMDGQRKAFYHDYNFQCLAGSPELNCCSTNAARGLGMLSEWALMTSVDGIAVNHYGPGAFTVATPSGQPLTLEQDTEYPLQGQVSLKVVPTQAERFTLRLRIPQWSAQTYVSVNGSRIDSVVPGAYLALDRVWQAGDVVELFLDMSPHFWVGQRECADLTSIYRGPILLAYDQCYNTMDPDDLPILNGQKLAAEPVSLSRRPIPWLLLRFQGQDGRDLILCDFASAGAVGSHYRSWLPVADVPEQRLSFAIPR